MRTLYHQPLCPVSRKVRLVMAEKQLDVSTVEENEWERRDEFLALNPSGCVPVLVEEDGTTICGAGPIVEYLEDAYPDVALLPGTPAYRAETRRLVEWFDDKFAQEVSTALVYEKIIKRSLSASYGGGAPDMAIVRTTLHNIRYHLDYICYLMENRSWLAGDALSVADFTAAAHLSCLDYVGDVPWSQYPDAKDWYVRLKSRPSFRGLLADHIPGMPPPRVYANLDF